MATITIRVPLLGFFLGQSFAVRSPIFFLLLDFGEFCQKLLITKLKEKTLILIRTKSKDFGFCHPENTKKTILIV
jgi:hypothetical protein